MIVVNIMRKISTKESEIGNFLNSKRDKAYIDIYRENDFGGLGILIDNELNIYKYEWKTSFSSKTNGFSINNALYELKGKIDYEVIEDYLLNKLNITSNEYINDSNEDIRTTEIIRLKNCECELENSDLFEKIKEMINSQIKENL